MINTRKHHYWLYVLKLQQGKYYVGITSQTPEKRFQEHLHGRKTYWTEKYPPLEIYDTKDLGNSTIEESRKFENIVTRRYMKERGINNVRGGNYTQTSDLIARFGIYYDALDWQALTTIILLLLIIVALALKIYL